MVTSATNGPELFGSNQKESKLVMKNHIGYHFKKVVKEVNQELFVSRQIDVTSIFMGLKILEQAHKSLDLHCVRMSVKETALAVAVRMKEPSSYSSSLPNPMQRYRYVQDPPGASYIEAKSRCQALGLQLPEVYSTVQADLLSSFLRQNGLTKCFAGLEPDLNEAIFRFAATGFPIWRTPHTTIYSINGQASDLILKMDDPFAKWLYGSDSKLYFRDTLPAVHLNSKLGDPHYRNGNTIFSQIIGPIVCETKWSGETYSHFLPRSGVFRTAHKSLNISSSDVEGNRVKRSPVIKHRSELPPDEIEEIPLRSLENDTRHPRSQRSDLDTLREYCMSVASQALDVKNEMMSKIQNVLSLTDISFHMDNHAGRRKRSPLIKGRRLKRSPLGKVRRKRFFLAKIAFKMGFGLIWNLFGFAQKVSDYREQKRMKQGIATNKLQSIENREAIREMSKTLLDHSISISQLKITTADLERRVYSLETKLDSIQSTVSNITHKLDTVVEISLISNIIVRIQQSMNTGYDVLKDIIHCSLLGQTSPLLLPLDQMIKVQDEVRRVSDAVLDVDFIKMQSIVISDPTNPSTLLVVVNVAALSRKSVDIVRLVPIPSYEDGKTFIPILDYTSVILDQSTYTYSVLTLQEEQECISSRCYVQDTERPLSQTACGVPQFYEQQKDTCVYEETQSNGIFLKSMLPDGVFFAFRSEVNSQLFCNDNKDVGAMKKLTGMGVLQLPNGCTLSVTNSASQTVKVKGPAMYRLIEADDLTLILNGPLGSIQTDKDSKATNKASTYEGLLASQLNPVFTQMTDANVRIAETHTYLWILLGTAIVTVIIVLVVAGVYCRHYYKIFQKIYTLRIKVGELVQQVINLTNAREHLNNARARIQNLIPTPRLPRSLVGRGLLNRLASRNHAVKHDEGEAHDVYRPSSPSAYISLQELNSNQREDRTYVSFRTIPDRDSNSAPEFSSHTMPRRYPSLSPFIAEMKTEERSEETMELDRESSEVEELCRNKKFPS